jgi:hypothetical protein
LSIPPEILLQNSEKLLSQNWNIYRAKALLFDTLKASGNETVAANLTAPDDLTMQLCREMRPHFCHGARSGCQLLVSFPTNRSLPMQRAIEEETLLDLSTAIEQFFGDVQAAAQTIAPLIAAIGFIGLGVMYMASSWPLIGDWKKDNPKAANQVVMGLLFVIFASSVTTLITFS